MELVELIYQLTKRFSDDERFGLTSQLRRSAVSVPSNIAEGHGRGTRKDYAAYVSVAKGSLQEAHTQLLIVIRLGYATKDDTAQCLVIIGDLERMLNSLRRKLVT